MTRSAVGSMICPDCRKLINADEKRCPYCNAWNPRRWTETGGKLFGDKLDMVTIIPAACIILYLFSLALDVRSALGSSSGAIGLLSPSQLALAIMGMTSGAQVANGNWWTVFTAIYLHGSILHILFNVLWLRQLGPQVEEAYGTARFFTIFTIAGVLGFVASNTVSGTPTIGASGGVFGLLAALIVHGRRVGGILGGMMSRQLWQWAIVLFVLGFIMQGVNNWAHAGGFAGGWVAASLFGSPRREPRSVVLFATVLLAATLFGFIVVAIRIGRAFLS